ncbi:MAG TPA: DUF501 domain-containing protein, partial [Acidimicrobiales bacterium]|nr:DUF501 domain-containing protein [Acidimicrobiales bacterium]
EAAVDPAALDAAHRRYAAERDAALPTDHRGHRPTGGVGGARRGVKCLHAHLAWFLAGGQDPVGRWVADRVGLGGDGERPRGAVAAVDCGTNSTRLLVMGAEGRALRRLMRITRLGQGVDAAGRLDEEALRRTMSVLGEYRGEMDRLGVTSVRVSATSAVRDAANREEFLAAATDQVGARPELLTGEEEGRLAYAGATACLDATGGPYVVVDVGGGSTEIIVGTQPGEAGCPEVVSIDMGCVRVSERFLHHDPPQPAEVATARAAIDRELDRVLEVLPGAAGARRVVGLAGTVSALAAIHQGLDHYERDRLHHVLLAREDVASMLATLAGEPRTARVARPGLEEERADVIVGGTLVLATVMTRLGASECLVSEADLLDGLARSLLDIGAT